MVVCVGVAVTVSPVVADNPVAGDHAYDTAPPAVNSALSPVQTVIAEETVVTAGVFTATAIGVLYTDVPVKQVTFKR